MKSVLEDWSAIRVFLAVYRKGSTLAASRDLGMSQPTVARRIDVLEHELGISLFDRDTRGLHPTDAAKQIFPMAEAAEAAFAELTKVAVGLRKRHGGPIRITAPRLNFSPMFTQILADFTALHPNTRFELISSYRLLDLCAGEADVALRITRQITDDRLICTRLNQVTSTLYASKSYAKAFGLPKSEADFAGHRFVVYDPTTPSMMLNNWLLERISEDQIVSRSADAESVTAAIAAGLGIGPVSTTLSFDYPSLVACFEPMEDICTTSWLVISPQAYRRPEVRAFAKFFAPRFRADYAAYKAFHLNRIKEEAERSL
ncbi:LysR family transcriptional regulator [Thioclava sp. FR2]|uniref:LysR family transcriptional regulator n=1 Tax=Thioclava sp. FR2 TaxID=3445780 RepID=UPI003EBEE570